MKFFAPLDRGLILTLGSFLFISILALTPAILKTSAGSAKSANSEAQSNKFGDYDIRTDKKASGRIAEIRGRASKNASEVMDLRDGFARGEEKLRGRVRNLKVEYNSDLKIPEVITPNPGRGREFLTPPGQEKRSEKLKGFLRNNPELTGVSAEQVSLLKLSADYKNPENEFALAEFEQEIDGVPVFRGSVKAGFTKDNEIIRIINNLAAGLDYNNISRDFGDPEAAFHAAAGHIGHAISQYERVNAAESKSDKIVFGSGSWAPTAEKFYFPTEPGVAVPAWRVLIWEDDAAYYVIVDAADGTMLWRKNITDSQTQSATYNVYANPNAMINVADNPFPMTPGPTTLSGAQGSPIPRTLITRVGNEAPYTFNNLGWITDGSNITDGNNAEAGLDRESPNLQNNATPGIDPNGVASGINRVFDFPINPGVPAPSGSPSAGDSPLPEGQSPAVCQAQGTATAPTDYQKAVVTQLFYITNWYHDETYRLGFTEAARNFQNSNFGRGGVELDRVAAESQDCSGANNANFSTPADGGRGRMQMYIFTAPTPDFDGSLDADVVVHELTHGLSNRLHGNGSGLSGLNMSRAMGEGWSDFYAHAMLSEPSDPINGVYPTGGYAKYGSVANFNNYYYGVRRFPKAVMAFTGVNGKPHNPLTFNDIDVTKINLSDGAFSPATNPTADGVHAAGEVWSSALWEVRAKYVARLGWVLGNRRVLQHVTDGMKLAPISPTFLQERDAIIAGALATGTAEDVADIWAGFAIRGMGASASIQNNGGSDAQGTGTGATRVTEAFDLPNLVQTPDITVSDSTGDNDGIFEPGEAVRITVPLKNITGLSADNVSAQIVGGGNASYGTIAHNGTASNQINFTIPAGTACGAALAVTINVTSSLGPVSFQRVIQIGQPVVTVTETFDGVTAPGLPAGWAVAQILNGINFVTTTNNTNSAPNALFAANSNSGANAGGTDITSPATAITSQAAILSFRNRYDTEPGWDGGVLEISINGGAFQDIIAAGGTFIENGYNSLMTASDSSAGYIANPLNGRSGWTGNSGGYVTTRVRLPAAAAGQNVQFKFRFGADDNTTGVGPNPGWYIDNVQIFGQASCSFTAANIKSRADFDGDGRSDISIFRPSDGKWYVVQSTEGIHVISWGVNGDKIVPGRYDADNKTDYAIFRESDGKWYVLGTNGFTMSTVPWGVAGDKPVVGDFNGDGKNDPAIFRPSENRWYVYGVATQDWGQAGDLPVPGDYNGDGTTDFGIFRPSTGQWYIATTTGVVTTVSWGQNGDKPVPADYDGDNKDDFAIWRPSEGKWYIVRSGSGIIENITWGVNGDIPVPGDFDGDGRDDLGIYRNGTWYQLRWNGTISIQNWGVAGDVPVPAGYFP
jgi:hypothetical protein